MITCRLMDKFNLRPLYNYYMYAFPSKYEAIFFPYIIYIKSFAQSLTDIHYCCKIFLHQHLNKTHALMPLLFKYKMFDFFFFKNLN